MTTYLLIGSALIALILLYFISTTRSRITTPHKKEQEKDLRGPCILCGSPLSKGERMASQEFKGEKDSIVRIMGCPHCYGPGAVKERTCPVCNKKMPPESYLQGRMWLKKTGKKHLHISGCTQCMVKKK